jgi:hypothetical protein
MWITQALSAAGVPVVQDGKRHDFPAVSPPKRPFSFMFVRHPLTWYQSYWAYRMSHNWEQTNKWDDDLVSTTFSGFIEKALKKKHDGRLSDMYRRMTLVSPQSAMYIGRYESLVEDLITALTAAGEQFDEHALRAFPAVNARSQLEEWKEKCAYTPELAEALCTSEKGAMDLYGYSLNDVISKQAISV